MWAQDVKNQVIKMREQGATFKEIGTKFLVPKSTLSGWVKGIDYPDHLAFTDRNEWLKKIRKQATRAIQEKKKQKIDKISSDVKSEVESWSGLINISVKKSLISFLYWAEGLKRPENTAGVKFANTDPKLILFFLLLLKSCYPIDQSRLKVRLYLHWYHNKKATKAYWQNLLEIPESQFGKIYVKKRSKSKRFKKNFMGVCFIEYNSVDLRREIMCTAFAVYDKMMNQILHP